VTKWFDRRRPLALSIGCTGISLFCIIFPPLFVYLNDNYGARGALLIYAGIAANSCIGGALLRDINDTQKVPISVKIMKKESCFSFPLPAMESTRIKIRILIQLSNHFFRARFTWFSLLDQLSVKLDE